MAVFHNYLIIPLLEPEIDYSSLRDSQEGRGNGKEYTIEMLNERERDTV